MKQDLSIVICVMVTNVKILNTLFYTAPCIIPRVTHDKRDG